MDPINLYCYPLFRFNCHQFHLDWNFIYYRYKIFWYCRVFYSFKCWQIDKPCIGWPTFWNMHIVRVLLMLFFSNIYQANLTMVTKWQTLHWMTGLTDKKLCSLVTLGTGTSARDVHVYLYTCIHIWRPLAHLLRFTCSIANYCQGSQAWDIHRHLHCRQQLYHKRNNLNVHIILFIK